MALSIIGYSGTVAEVSGTEFRSIRTENKPMDFQGLGSYSSGGITGILPAALGANSEIMQFRWADPTRFAVIRKVRFSAAVSTTFFAAGVPIQIDLIKATAWTVQGTGGTSPTIAATLKCRTSMSSSLVANGDIRYASTAALGAGTKTLEANSLGAIVAAAPITASLTGTIVAPGTILWQAEIADGEHPIVLAQNEGLVIRSVAVPATGTWTAAFQVDWTEVVSY